MSVLFVMPSWPGVWELWMHRMIEELEPDIALLAAPRPAQKSWRERIPALDFHDALPRLWRRLARKTGMAVAPKPSKTSAAILKDAVRSPRVGRVLVQYLTLAAQFEEVWSSTNKPLFVHCHGYDTTWDMRSHERPDRPVHPQGYLDAVRRLAQRAILIAPCQDVARRLSAVGVPADRVVVKYLGVPASEEFPRREPRTSGITILYLGRLYDCKGPDLVIRAFELAQEQGLDGRLLLAGDGPLRTACELLRSRSPVRDRISLLGPTDEAMGERLRAEADIFTAHNCLGPLSRQEEAFGTSLVEAMGAGLPVITGRSGGLTEHIEHGKDGFLVEPGDVEAHAETLLQLARDPALRHQIGEAAWRKVRERYTCEKERTEFRGILGLDGSQEDHRNPQSVHAVPGR